MVSLSKPKEKTVGEKIDEFALKYANIIMPLAIVMLLLLFIGLCYAIVGVSAVESGNLYNRLGDVI